MGLLGVKCGEVGAIEEEAHSCSSRFLEKDSYRRR